MFAVIKPPHRGSHSLPTGDHTVSPQGTTQSPHRGPHSLPTGDHTVFPQEDTSHTASGRGHVTYSGQWRMNGTCTRAENFTSHSHQVSKLPAGLSFPLLCLETTTSLSRLCLQNGETGKETAQLTHGTDTT
jgi:hypothetical protein